MEIRRMVINDYSDVYELWMSCKDMGLNNIVDSQKGVEKFLERNPETSFVALIQGKIVGVIMAGNDGRRGYIYHTAVSPLHRHQGIGKQLVDKALEALYKLDIIKVALVVFDKNDVGNAFWEKQGFTTREDLVYRNKSLTRIERIDT
ncbi:MAG: GNAT family N-acetyltransferase [Oscillospiraceae bacterium]|nr:GNAT family N-acetyltransferase [Oscillospiraceae bacterium]